MRRQQNIIFAICVAVTAVLASWLDLPRPSRAHVPQDVTIGTLAGRNQNITITASPDGPRYSIYRDGAVVATDLTLDQLRAQHPEAHQQLDSATAASGTGIWAGLDLRE